MLEEPRQATLGEDCSFSLRDYPKCSLVFYGGGGGIQTPEEKYMPCVQLGQRNT